MISEEIFLEKDEIALRLVQEGDAEKFVKILNNEAVNKNLTIGSFPLSIEEEKEWIKDARERKEEGKIIPLTIILKKDERKIIGECSATRLDAENRSPMVGIFLAEDEWRNGYGKKTMTLLIGHLFKRFEDITSISSGAIEYNEASIALHKSLGFKQEGRRREEIFYDGKRYDLVKFGILRREWRNQNSGS